MKNLLKLSIVAFMLSLIPWGAIAQKVPGQGDMNLTTTLVVCENTTKNVGVALTAGSAYTWTISGTSGTDWTLNTGTLIGKLNDPGKVIENNLLNISWLKAGNYTITVNETTVNNCPGQTVNLSVTVNPLPVIGPKPFGPFCSDATLTGVTLATVDDRVIPETPVAITKWDVTLKTLPAGLTSGASNAVKTASPTVTGTTNANLIAGDTYTNTTGVQATVVYEVTPYAGTGTDACAGTPYEISVTIDPKPVFNPIPTASAVCSNGTIGVTLPTPDNSATPLAITEWNITNVNLNGLTAVVSTTGVQTSASAIANDKYENKTDAAVNVVYTITPKTAAGCEGTPFTITVPVNPQPEIVPSPTASACSGTAINQTLATTGTNGVGITKWDITANALPAGLTGTATTGTGITDPDAIKNDVFTNTTSSALNVVYNVIPYSANNCAGESYTITVSITAAPIIENQTATVCSNAAFSTDVTIPTVDKFSTPISGTGSGYYITNVVVDPSLNGVSGITPDPTKTTLVQSGALAAEQFRNLTNGNLTVTYTVVPHTTCDGPSFTYTVTIRPEPQVSNGAATVCSNDNAGSTTTPIAVTNGTVSTYTIVSVTPGAGVTASGTVTATGDTFSTIAALEAGVNDDVFVNSSTTTNGTVTYRVKPTNADGCDGAEFTITKTIYPTVQTSPIYHD